MSGPLAGMGALGICLVCSAPAAARVSIGSIEAETVATTFHVSATTVTTGYFTVHRGLGKECGSALQVRAGWDQQDAPAYRHGSLPLRSGMVSRHTVAGLEHNSAYTLCFADGTNAGPVSRNFVTELLKAEEDVAGLAPEPVSVDTTP